MLVLTNKKQSLLAPVSSYMDMTWQEVTEGAWDLFTKGDELSAHVGRVHYLSKNCHGPDTANGR